MATRLPAPQRKGGILEEIPDLCLYRKMVGIPAGGTSSFRVFNRGYCRPIRDDEAER